MVKEGFLLPVPARPRRSPPVRLVVCRVNVEQLDALYAFYLVRDLFNDGHIAPFAEVGRIR